MESWTPIANVAGASLRGRAASSPLGYGLLAFFGYPQASEDDAERAVNAGLGLVEAVGQLRDDTGAAQSGHGSMPTLVRPRQGR